MYRRAVPSLFDPLQLGPVKLRNRAIRAAAFEGMAPGHEVSDQLVEYHRSVARGGVGMSTVAYAAIAQSGLTFAHQLWLRPEAVPGLRRLTDALHAERAKASIQLGHCGNMAADRRVAGERALSPSGRFNLYGPVWPREMTTDDLAHTAKQFGEAVRRARDAGFDAVEVHAGHGYLISQFLSPWTNHRTDAYGGPLENRLRFAREVMAEVKRAAGNDLAVVVKTNLRDGFKGGMELEEAVQVAKALEEAGADALVLTGGFVSRAPMYIMRGDSIASELSRRMKPWWMRMFVGALGEWLIPPVPFTEAYFLEDAKVVRAEVKLPLVYVGGVASQAAVDRVLESGFQGIAMARALIREPDFLQRLRREGERGEARCDHCNHCAARIYTTSMGCHHLIGKTAP